MNTDGDRARSSRTDETPTPQVPKVEVSTRPRIVRAIGGLSLCLVLVLSACSHVAYTRGSFRAPAAAVTAAAAVVAGPVVLRLDRHMDTVIRGPDIEEDQVLILELRDFTLSQKLTVPSDQVKPRFTVTRFGPSSVGESFEGWVMVQEIVEDRIRATLHLEIVSHTAKHSHTQTDRFRGEYEFRPAPAPPATEK